MMKPTLVKTWKHYVAVTGCFFIFIVGSWVAIAEMISIFDQLQRLPSQIIFNKKDLWMLGVGIVSGSLGGIILIEHWYPRLFTKKTEKKVTRAIIIGMLLTFLFPQVIHYSVSHYLEIKKYIKCDQKHSTQIRFAVIIYSNSQQQCHKEK